VHKAPTGCQRLGGLVYNFMDGVFVTSAMKKDFIEIKERGTI
jgi:hypothetical protein